MAKPRGLRIGDARRSMLSCIEPHGAETANRGALVAIADVGTESFRFLVSPLVMGSNKGVPRHPEAVGPVTEELEFLELGVLHVVADELNKIRPYETVDF